MAATQLQERVQRMLPVSAPLEQKAEVQRLFEMLRNQAPVYKLVGPRGETHIPESVFYVLERVAEVLARGDAVTVVPVGKELTTQQAADLLNVSRQYLVRILDEGKLPFTKTGKHRRLRIEDVLAYREARDAERKGSLDELARLSQEFGGYEELE